MTEPHEPACGQPICPERDAIVAYLRREAKQSHAMWEVATTKYAKNIHWRNYAAYDTAATKIELGLHYAPAERVVTP